MFSGCQFSLYPMTDAFVDVILSAVRTLDGHRDHLRIETDDLGTLLVGPPERLVPALQQCFLSAAGRGGHTVMTAHLSRGCPGEPDDPICASGRIAEATAGDRDRRVEQALARLPAAAPTWVQVSGQIALHPLGRADYMDEIAACIAFAKRAQVFADSKHFCTKIAGDAARIFPVLEQAFVGFGGREDHVVLTATLSTGSPSTAR